MKVASFYRFLDLPGVESFRDDLQAFCEQQGVLGTILVAEEGFNGTICGSEAAILAVFEWLRQRLGLEAINALSNAAALGDAVATRLGGGRGGRRGMNMARQVLFICTGNICRSPMAEGMLKQRLWESLAQAVTRKVPRA